MMAEFSNGFRRDGWWTSRFSVMNSNRREYLNRCRRPVASATVACEGVGPPQLVAHVVTSGTVVRGLTR